HRNGELVAAQKAFRAVDRVHHPHTAAFVLAPEVQPACDLVKPHVTPEHRADVPDDALLFRFPRQPGEVVRALLGESGVLPELRSDVLEDNGLRTEVRNGDRLVPGLLHEGVVLQHLLPDGHAEPPGKPGRLDGCGTLTLIRSHRFAILPAKVAVLRAGPGYVCASSHSMRSAKTCSLSGSLNSS